MSEYKILTKEQLRDGGTPRTEVLPLPELGEGVAVRVRGFSVGDTIKIRKNSVVKDADGKPISYDEEQDIRLSVMRALVEPEITAKDTEWIDDLGQGVVNRIISKARELGYQTQTSYEEMKDSLRRNPYLRRVYSLCVNKLGRLPSELADIPEAEFNTALAALELDAEDAEKKREQVLKELESGE